MQSFRDFWRFENDFAVCRLHFYSKRLDTQLTSHFGHSPLFYSFPLLLNCLMGCLAIVASSELKITKNVFFSIFCTQCITCSRANKVAKLTAVWIQLLASLHSSILSPIWLFSLIQHRSQITNDFNEIRIRCFVATCVLIFICFTHQRLAEKCSFLSEPARE